MKKLEDHNYNGIDATIIADSKNLFGNRITTYIVTFPRIVLAEFNTHRMLSRNSASSRAVPHDKMIKKVEETPFIPIRWMKNHKGMQGTEYLEGTAESEAEDSWLQARDAAVAVANNLSNELEATKQITNRLLEPWMWHTAIVTATEWENFYALRAHEAAEIHIAALADKMLEQANLSTPKERKEGEWHIPFGENIDVSRALELLESSKNVGNQLESIMIKIATARCARVSYLNFEGKDDYEADIKLHDRLASLGHWSPFEHCAKAISGEDGDIVMLKTAKLTQHQIDDFKKQWEDYMIKSGPLMIDTDIEMLSGNSMSGNFRGFTQYRKMFDNENKEDTRLLKK